MTPGEFGEKIAGFGAVKVLLVTFYYPPDLSAGSFRAGALVEALTARGISVDVLTSTPNRYAANAGNRYGMTRRSGEQIVRISVPAHRSGIVDQIKTFGVFAKGAWRAALKSDADIVVATSSRLFTASLGAAIARRLNAPLYLDIRDVFTETVENVFRGKAIRLGMPAISLLERWTLRSAARVNLVSPPFADYFQPIVDHRDFANFTNGIDDLFLKPLSAPSPGAIDRKPVVLIAGNIGEGQGLHHVMPGLAAACPEITFRIIGDGGRRATLAEALNSAGVDNVELMEPIPRNQLIKEYAAANILFLHLNDLPAFHRVLPSKLFEYAATGRPMLAGVAGYPREFLEANLSGVETFNPCDIAGGARALKRLLEGAATFDRRKFAKRYARSAIMAEMAEDIELAVASV